MADVNIEDILIDSGFEFIQENVNFNVIEGACGDWQRRHRTSMHSRSRLFDKLLSSSLSERKSSHPPVGGRCLEDSEARGSIRTPGHHIS